MAREVFLLRGAPGSRGRRRGRAPAAPGLERGSLREERIVLPDDGTWVMAADGEFRLRAPASDGAVVEDRAGGRDRGGGTRRRRRLVLPGESLRTGPYWVSVPAGAPDLPARGRALLGVALRGEAPPVGPLALVREGPDAGASAVLRDGLVCGREPGLALSLTDPTLSRRHARIRLDGHRVEVEDLGARNGVRRPGGAARKSLRVNPGGEVRLGGTVLLLLPAPGRIEPSGGGPPRERASQVARRAARAGRAAILALAAGALAASALALAVLAVLG